MILNKLSPVEQGDQVGRRDLFRLLLPRDGTVFTGRVGLDTQKCSLCGLCAAGCPTGAIKTSVDEKMMLVFREDLCDACGHCAEVCPEQCLSLERALAVDKKQAASVVLIEDGFARCSRCGSVVGPQAMIARIRLKLGDSDSPTSSGVRHAALLLCPACKSGHNLAGEEGDGHLD